MLGSRGTTSESLFFSFFFPPTVQQHAPLCVGKKLGMSCLLRKLAYRKKISDFPYRHSEKMLRRRYMNTWEGKLGSWIALLHAS